MLTLAGWTQVLNRTLPYVHVHGISGGGRRRFDFGGRQEKTNFSKPFRGWAPEMSGIPRCVSGIIFSLRCHSSRLSCEVSRSRLDSFRKNTMTGLNFLARAWMLIQLLVSRSFFFGNHVFWARARTVSIRGPCKFYRTTLEGSRWVF
jgi:hypothetical protein